MRRGSRRPLTLTESSSRARASARLSGRPSTPRPRSLSIRSRREALRFRQQLRSWYEMLDRESLILVFRSRQFLIFRQGSVMTVVFPPSFCSVSLLFLAVLWFSIVFCARERRKWRKSSNLRRSVEEKWRSRGCSGSCMCRHCYRAPADNRSPLSGLVSRAC